MYLLTLCWGFVFQRCVKSAAADSREVRQSPKCDVCRVQRVYKACLYEQSTGHAFAVALAAAAVSAPVKVTVSCWFTSFTQRKASLCPMLMVIAAGHLHYPVAGRTRLKSLSVGQEQHKS